MASRSDRGGAPTAGGASHRTGQPTPTHLGSNIHDRASSARWHLNDTQYVELFDHSDGGGKSYNKMSGYGSSLEDPQFSDSGFNDLMASFQWSGLIPMKETVEPVLIDLEPYRETTPSVVVTDTGVNDGPAPMMSSISFGAEQQETTTLTVTNTFSTGVTVSESIRKEVDTLLQKTTYSLSVDLSFNYDKSTTRETSVTNTSTIAATHDYIVPPFSSYEATLAAIMAVLPDIVCETNATRWYMDQVPGSERDPENGWYKRNEKVTFTLRGSVSTSTDFNLDVRELKR